MSEGSGAGNFDLDTYFPIWIGLVTFIFYSVTLKPAIGWGIDAEVALQSLVVPGTAEAVDHPIRVIFGSGIGQFRWLFPVLSHDILQNLLSAIFSAGSVSLLYLICVRLGWSRESAVITCITLGLSHLFWHVSVTSGPFPISMFLLLVLIYTTLHCIQHESATWWIAGTAFLLGLGIGETPFFLLLLPGYLTLAVWDNRFLRHWASVLLFILFLLVGYGWSLVLAAFMAGGMNKMDLLPIAPERFGRLFHSGRFPEDLFSFGTLFFYQFPLFGVVFGLLGILVQWMKKRSIGWVLLFPFLLSIPLYSSAIPDQMFYQSSLTFVIFSIWIGEGMGWFLNYAYLRREAMDSSYGALVTAVGIAMGLSPLMLYASSGELQEKTGSIITSILPDRSFPRMERTTYYLHPWKVNEDGTKRLWRDTKKIPDGSVLIADPLASAPLRYYIALHGKNGRMFIRDPKGKSYQSNPEKTVYSWIRSWSEHDGSVNEPPKRGVYSLDTHPMYQHERLKQSFEFDQPLLTEKGTVSGTQGEKPNQSDRVHVLSRVERSPIWRIRLPDK